MYETDLILEELARQYEEEKDQEELEAEQQFLDELEEELLEMQEDEDDEQRRFWDWYWNGVGMYTKEWFENDD